MKVQQIERKKWKKKEKIPPQQIEEQFTGDLEETVEKSMGEKLSKIKKYENKFKERWEFEGDGEFYFSICFRSKEEKEEFLKVNNIRLREGQYIFVEELPEFK